MDNSGKIYSLLDQASFNQWLTEFFNKKSNELAYSRQNQPKRMEKLVLDLSTAQTEGYKVPVPFKSTVISRVYSTASGTDKYGSIKILFDQPNIGNLKNAVNLFVNDTLKSETLFTEAYLLWDAQADTSMEIFFFPDLEVSTGTTKTQIVGTVSVQNTNATSFYEKPPIPDSVTAFEYNTTSTGTIGTVPAGKYWIVRPFGMGVSTSTDRGLLYLNTGSGAKLVFGLPNGVSGSIQGIIVAKAGHVLTYDVIRNNIGTLGGTIEEYSV